MKQLIRTPQQRSDNDFEHHRMKTLTCYTWLVNARSQNIPISATMLKTKALYFAKELGCNDFHASDGWLDRWKKRTNVSFKTVLGISFTSTVIIYIFYVCFLSS